MADRISKVRTDYRAKNTSGSRPTSRIAYFVVHDAEAPNPTGAAEGVGAYFQSGNGGSTHYGVDNDSTQRYLPETAICWGAPPLNVTGIHMELAGLARYSRNVWLRTYGPMLRRAGWLIRSRCAAHGIPTRALSTAELKARGPYPAKGRGGIVTHRQISAVWHQTTHTDPGPDFPMDVLLAWVAYYQQPLARRRGRPVLHLGSTGSAVRRLETRLKAANYKPGVVDGEFTAATEKAVAAFQADRSIPATGVVDLATWRALLGR